MGKTHKKSAVCTGYDLANEPDDQYNWPGVLIAGAAGTFVASIFLIVYQKRSVAKTGSGQTSQETLEGKTGAARSLQTRRRTRHSTIFTRPHLTKPTAGAPTR